MLKRLSNVISANEPGLIQTPGTNVNRRTSHADGAVRFNMHSLQREGTGSTRMSLAGALSNTGGSRLSITGVKQAAKRLSRSSSLKRSTDAELVPHRQEPTFRMEPKTKFRSLTIEKVIKDVLEDRLENFKYTDQKLSATITRILTDEIKYGVKAHCFDRYKIVVVVTLAQKCKQGIVATSRCNWDTKNDNFASYTFENANVVCSASVFGVYME